MGINLENVKHFYPGNKCALDNISLKVDTGIFGLLGENGAGKTTLMRILTTLMVPSEGKITIDGIELTGTNYLKIRKIIGYLPQEFGFYPRLSVQETLDYFCILHEIFKGERKERISYLLENLNLAEHKNKKVKDLSGGMKRRLGLAQALINNPRVLIIDEPTAGLDPEERIRIRNLLKNISENKTVIFSTHIVEDIFNTCNNLALISKGELRFSGSTADFIKSVDGLVWECAVKDDNELEKLKSKVIVTDTIYTQSGFKVRAISKNPPKNDANAVGAHMEYAYMYFTKRRG